jgi:hypothetical protein
MGKDTLNIKIATDSIIRANQFIENTITLEKTNKSAPDYFSKGLDFISSIAWPLTIIIIILLFKKHIIPLLNIIGMKIRDSKSLTISKEGIVVASGVTDEIPLDKKTNETTQDIFPEFPMTDNESKKILSTLWFHQNEYDKNYRTRWTFTLGANSPDYLSFVQSSQRLQWLGLITYDQSSGQFFLTDLGIKYCEKNKKSIGDFSYFKK